MTYPNKVAYELTSRMFFLGWRRDRLQGILKFMRLFSIVFTLFLAACSPSLQQTPILSEEIKEERDKQRELALSVFNERQKRLYLVAYPLLLTCSEFNQKDTLYTYGFTLHDANLYTALYGEEYKPAAQKVFSLKEHPIVHLVHPRSHAASLGLRPGDRIVAIEGQDTKTLNAIELTKLISQYGFNKKHLLHALVERENLRFELEIQGASTSSYNLQLINDDSVNAFADGEIVGITMGMMRFASRDEELALVLGHELAHNALGHVEKKAGNTFLGSLFDILFATQLGINTQGMFGGVANITFSQDFELEADYAGLYLVAKTGYDTQRAPQFWRNMAVEYSGAIEKNFLSSHPSTPERFLALEKTVDEINRKKKAGLPLIPEKKFKRSDAS